MAYPIYGTPYIGNYICILFVVLETFLINGAYSGWSILTAMFKEDQLFYHSPNWIVLLMRFSPL